MDWITKEEVKQAAKDGAMASMKCSLAHHRQGEKCTRGELIDAIEDEVFQLDSNLCACCNCFDNCDTCLLTTKSKGNCDERCCNGAYGLAQQAIVRFHHDDSPANFAAFQLAEGKVCDYIQAVIDKEAEPEVTIGVGDKFMIHGSNIGTNKGKHILAGGGPRNEVTMVSLDSGIRWNAPVKVKDRAKITKQEFNEIYGCCKFTRYWDNAKQEKVGEEVEPKAKLEWKIGDYGMATVDGKDRAFVYVGSGHAYEFQFDGSCGQGDYYNIGSLSNLTRLGNIFSDIAAKTETLKRFQVKGGTHDSLAVCAYKNHVNFNDYGDEGLRIDNDQLPQLILNLQKVANGIKAKK